MTIKMVKKKKKKRWYTCFQAQRWALHSHPQKENNRKDKKPSYGFLKIFSNRIFFLYQDSTPAAFLQEDWLSSSFPWHKCIRTWFSPYNKSICLQTGSCWSGRVWNRQTGGQFWKCSSRAGAQFSHSAQLGSYNQTPSIPSGAGKGLSPVLLSLVTKARPWEEAMGLSSSFPRGQETSANTHGLLVGMAAKWSLWWQSTYLMETHTLPPADSPKGLTSFGVSTVSLPLGQSGIQAHIQLGNIPLALGRGQWQVRDQC